MLNSKEPIYTSQDDDKYCFFFIPTNLEMIYHATSLTLRTKEIVSTYRLHPIHSNLFQSPSFIQFIVELIYFQFELTFHKNI